jgi:uncharacterized protein YdeI (YjbR/CyaY-like superfamily)
LRNPQEWHDWLVQKHDQKDQIWLKIKKSHTKGEGIRLAEAVEEALCFGWIDGKMYSLDKESFHHPHDSSQARERVVAGQPQTCRSFDGGRKDD